MLSQKEIDIRCDKGACFLDVRWPNWWKEINILRLRMSRATYQRECDYHYECTSYDIQDCGCVGSQLDSLNNLLHPGWGSYGSFVKRLCLSDRDEIDFGFTIYPAMMSLPFETKMAGWKMLDTAWKNEIEKRRKADASAS